MLSTFPIPIAPADEGDCDMMGLCFQWRQESLLREGESLEMTVRAGPKFSGELGTTAGPRTQRQKGLGRGIIGHLASHKSPPDARCKRTAPGVQEMKKNARPGVSRWPWSVALMSGWMDGKEGRRSTRTAKLRSDAGLTRKKKSSKVKFSHLRNRAAQILSRIADARS